MKRRRCRGPFFSGARDAKNKDISIDPREINEEIRDWNAADVASRRNEEMEETFPNCHLFLGCAGHPSGSPVPETDVMFFSFIQR